MVEGKMKKVCLFLCLATLLALAWSCSQQDKTADADMTDATETDAGDAPADSTKILMDLVDHYYKNVEHDSLAALAPKAMDYFRGHQLWREYYTTWCLLVNDLIWNGEMDKGFAEARQMHQDAVARNNAFGLSEAYTAMGIAYHFQRNYDEAVDSYEQALQHYPADADQSVKLNIYSYYCQVLADMKDFKKTTDVLSEWEQFLDHLTGGDTTKPEYAHWYFRYHRERYRVFFARRDLKQASKELDTMQSYLDKEADRELYEAQVAGFRTQVAMANRDYVRAMEWSDREIELCKEQDFNTFLNALRHRSEMLQQLGRYEEALLAYRSYDQQKDSLIKDDTRRQLNEMNKRFEVDELKAEKERTQLKHERTRYQMMAIIAFIVAVALVLFIYWRNRAAKKLQHAHRLLEASNRELQQSYEHLKVANMRAEESSKMKSNFIQQISHEIRTPLNILSGFTQVITTPGLELGDEEKADISKQITENTGRITSLVNKMLELSDASSQSVLERNDQVPAIMIASQAADNSGINQATHLTFDLQLDDASAETVLLTHDAQATRALTLLLDNARKFTRKPEAMGQVAADEKKASVVLRMAVVGNSQQFIVEDTGIGIPADEAEHIFEEFVQLNDYYDGTGIGLTIARSIARRLGGDVVLDTTYQPGARFVMSLPTA